MPEFVIVTYPVRRRVIINGAPNGFTNDTLVVSRASHQFDLGTPPDYTPLSQTVAVAGTAPTAPMTVAFLPVVASAVASAPPPVPTAAPRSRKGRKKVTRKAAARKKTVSTKSTRKSGKKKTRHK